MIPYGRAICYSGYRIGQSPITEVYPNEAEVLDDLLLLSKHYDYIRMYDISKHARSVLEVIKTHGLDLKVMLGVEPRGEISNPACPWGGLKTDAEIKENRIKNIEALDALLALAETYSDHVLALSVGNESTSPWHGNLMAPETIRDHALYLKTKTTLPVTFCEGADVFRKTGQVIAPALDVISIHSYPLWHRVSFDQAIQRTKDEYLDIKTRFPKKQVIMTEYGWTTSANDKMDASITDETHQLTYLEAMDDFSHQNQIVMFVFEAFDEPWKGSMDPKEPEKHWGLYDVKRRPKAYAKKNHQ
ncbi:MAG: hypothetical protein K9K93_03055 [Acholeplasmataceae bacterium]|nr:hypothetical protein [Acholeplasmataceae bacterium]